jgi:multidrug efflux system outer membrane protein
LVSANANIGVAKAMFFPQISLLGSGGAAFGHSQFGTQSIPAPLGIGTCTAGLSQPIFDAGALRNNLRLAVVMCCPLKSIFSQSDQQSNSASRRHSLG